MKRFSIIVSLLLVVTLFVPTSVIANDLTQTSEIIYLENGCYITIEITESPERASASKSGTKNYVYRSNSGNELWRASLRGTFTYTGTSATCTASSCTTTVTDTAWYEVSKNASRSGASAIGEFVMGHKILGITINKETVNMSLTCDANGNLS